MGLTAPTTRATGDLITSSIWNTDLVANLQYLHDHLLWGLIGSAGTISTGSGGYTAVRNSTGLYTITFSTAYAAIPAAVANSTTAAGLTIATIANLSTTLVQFEFFNTAGAVTNTDFTFLVMG